MACAVASAQTPADRRPRRATPAQGAAAAGADAAGPRRRKATTYQPDGRRDPFLNLLGTGSDAAGPAGSEARGPRD